MELTLEIRERLHYFMQLKHETGYTIHQKTDISATTVGNYLKGKVKKADNTKIKVICNVLGITLEQLLLGEGIHEPHDIKGTATEDKDIQYYIKEIFRKLQGADDQYLTLRKDMEFLRKEIQDLKKEIKNKNSKR